MSFKGLLKELLPPIVVKVLTASKNEGWFGNYPNWQIAKEQAGGYDSDIILDKVRESTLKVKNGEAVYERDSVIFDEIEYSWPLLAGIMWIAAQNDSKLDIIDFGGALGSSYYQNRKFLNELEHFSWNIVEQDHFVECGRESFENDQLHFFNTIDKCIESVGTVNVMLLSSVIQYLESPYRFIEEMIKYRIPFIVLDRTSLNIESKDVLTIQRVRESIYKASYPCWFFDKNKLYSSFKGYELVEEFDSLDQANIPSQFKGAIFRLCS